MKFLHIIPPSRRMMDTYIRMLRKNFDKDEHHFYFINECPESELDLFGYDNVQQMSGNSKWEKMKHLYTALNQADLVFWHGFIYPGRFMLFLFGNPKFLKKSVWVAWGIDLYNWKRTDKGLRHKVINALNYYCRCHLKAVIALLEPDKLYYKKIFPSKVPCYVIPYPISEESFAAMDVYRNWNSRKNGLTFVQVAHNAHTFNNHLEILEMLLPYAQENMRLFLPMSYGNDWHTSNKQYGRNITEYVEDHFPNKAYMLWRLMPQSSYTEFLWNMDIAIFNAERQNALGNILKLLYMGNKVYLTPDGPLYSYFKEKEIEVFNTKEIGTIPYSKFIERSSNTNAIDWIRKNYHPQYSIKKWKDGIEEICGCRLHYTTAFSGIEETQKDTVAKTPYYKSNYLNIMRYFSWGGLNTAKIPDAVIIGADTMGIRIAQWMLDCNKRKTTWFIKGFLDEHIESLNNTSKDYDVIGKWNEWHREPFDTLLCAIEDPNIRQKAVVYFKQRYLHSSTDTELNQSLFSEVIHPSSSVSDFATRGEGCIIGPHTFVDVGTELGDFVYINRSYIGDHTKIGNFCNIDIYCRIGCNVVIDDGITIPAGSIVPNGSHITNCLEANYLQPERGGLND
ncbi:TDP-N-acetylfucosamine:lipid II N-acetylfucosaminyltransferase [Clostridium sp. FS41]|uniref:TDP-N-acetylfucosamine:lipid II N-acetylfucosaminyltransferase n=1 Tax=Clostridium sp. FS41 TaxID=1609975 RepID=UPI0005D3A75A|nr:TDP-N-acetylfucosamine:lipid II N-acetylfucosaminyltransferase [Clostridium sp. FS41]KJJ65612.1 4-alpha-L-fucosyltransferase [Clostridium sp. FS41]